MKIGTVEEMLQRMSSMEISEWRVYFQLEQADLEQKSGGSTSTGPDRVITLGHSGGVGVE